MPKRSRSSGRVVGYHYVRDSSGRKHRVYGRGGPVKRTKGVTRSRRGGRFDQLILNAHNRAVSRALAKPKVDYFGDTIMGMGAYRRRGRGAPLDRHQVPNIKNTKAGGFIISHKEFVTDVPSAATQNFANFVINPSLSQTFPWLSSIAVNFEEWIPRGICWMYKSTSSDAVVSTNANAGLGAVAMATDYKVSNPSFGSKQQMEMYEGATSTKPSKDMIHFIECKKNRTVIDPLYCRTSTAYVANQGTNVDNALYDLGFTTVGVFGMQSTGANVGELWISYEIEFRKPRILPGNPMSDNGLMDHWAGSGTSTYTIAAPFNVVTTALPATPFGTTNGSVLLPTPSSNLGGRLSAGGVAANQVGVYPVNGVLASNQNISGFFGQATGANTYYFPPGVANGNYMIVYVAAYSVAGAVANPTLTLTNATGLKVIAGDTATGDKNTSSANTTRDMSIWFATVTASPASFTLVGSPGMTTPQNWDFYVIEVPISN